MRYCLTILSSKNYNTNDNIWSVANFLHGSLTSAMTSCTLCGATW
jgi:hypothetical protein